MRNVKNKNRGVQTLITAPIAISLKIILIIPIIQSFFHGLNQIK